MGEDCVFIITWGQGQHIQGQEVFTDPEVLEKWLLKNGWNFQEIMNLWTHKSVPMPGGHWTQVGNA